ncbi:MAG: ABC transporter ATP-binding protein [Firmicutes bacterium]|jgi:branched-chain amino acid transport system ATP-binding protein|nr:ABC transporter ATP-binding protein [Bacillota bacterium]
MLTVEDLNVYYGGIHALKGISFQVRQREIVTLIGANGAGKTTTLKTISGLVRARSGRISYQDQEISSTPAHVIAREGLCHVPEGRRVFADMTVAENLALGAYHRRDQEGIKRDLEWVYELFPRLAERRQQLAGTLSGGEQQMLAMGRGLMSHPRLLLLDEPSMGLAPLLVREIFEIVKQINAAGMTILLVEQNAHMALSVADTAYVLETGRIVFSGPAREVAANKQVREAYLGA